MKIRSQINLLLAMIALVVPLAIVVAFFAVSNIEQQTRNMAAAEELMQSATQLRQIAVDTILFHEIRAQDQWQRKIVSMKAELERMPSSDLDDQASVERIRNRILLAASVYPRLFITQDASIQGAGPSPESSAAAEKRIISALFVITQEVLDTGQALIDRYREKSKQSLRTFQIVIGLIILLMGILFAFVWWRVRSGILSPLRHFEQGTHHVAVGDYAYRLNLSQHDEIGELANAFDKMTSQVKQTQDDLVEAVKQSQRAEVALSESGQYTQAILDNAIDGIVTIDERGMIQSVNRSVESIFGYTSDELLGRNVNILMPEPFHSAHDNYLDQYRRTGQSRMIGNNSEVEGRRKSGQIFPMDLAISQSIHRGQRIFIGLVRDISLRKQQEQALGILSERLKIATEAAGVGIWDYSLVSNTLTWDAMMYALYGITPDTFEGVYEAWREGVHPDDQARGDAEIAQALAGEKPFNTSFRVVWPSGETHWIRAVATVQRDAKGAPLRMIGTNWDITAEKQADQMKTEFVSTVSHELRTPLTSICGSLGLVMGGAAGDVPPGMRPMLDIAHKNSLRLSCLINDLLDMEKLMAGKLLITLQVQALMPLIEQALASLVAYGEQHKVSFVITDRVDDVWVKVDGGRLQQVLANLLSNAAKFSPAGEQVGVSVQKSEHSVRVSVIDHGPGIPQAFRDRLFQKFSQADSSDTRQKGGTGLGLAITKELIERMQGRIDFSSEEGAGACFYFELPCCVESDIETDKLRA